MAYQISDINKYTQYWKDKFPNTYGDKTDEQIIELVRVRYPEQNLPTYQEALNSSEERDVGPQLPSDYPDGSLGNSKTNSEDIEPWYMTADFVPDRFQEEGLGSISADFFRKSYNESMAGLAYKAAYGEDRFTISEDYNPSFFAQAGAFAVGMLSPLDLGTMVATGALGKGAQLLGRTGLFGGTLFKRNIEKGILTKFASKNPKVGTFLGRAVEESLNLGVGGSSFVASHALVAEAARQRGEDPTKPVNISKALKVASDEFLHSFPMFAGAGFVTQGIMGPLYGYTQAMATKNPTYAQKLTMAATSPLARAGSEAALFTALPSVLGDEDAPKLGSPEFWTTLATNGLVITGMRGVGAAFEPKFVTRDGRKVSFDTMTFMNEYIKKSTKMAKDELKVTNNVIKTVKESGGDTKALLAKTRELNKIIGESEGAIPLLKKDLDFIQKVNNKIDTDASYLVKAKKRGSKENKELGEYQKIVNDHSKNYLGIIDDVLDDDISGELYTKMFNKAPDELELKSFVKGLENTKKSIIENSNNVDDYLTGNFRNSKDGITGGETALTPPKIKPTRESEINRYVDLLAAEKKVLPKEIRTEASYQRDIIIPGENILSLRKLKKAYESELKKRPGNPEAELTKALMALDVPNVSQLPVFSKKIAGKKPIKDYISELKLNKTNEKMLYQGISEFMQTRKSSNSPSNYKIVADYAKWLESKGKNLSQANRSLTDLYVNEQNAVGKFTTKNQRSQLNNSLSAFYGTGGVGKQPLDTGFAYKYMGTKEKTPAVSQLGVDRGGTLARQEKIALVEPKDYGLIRAKNKELVKEGLALQGKGKQTVDPLTYDVATELLYNFGSRGKDTFERLFIENIDIRNGIIREWSAGAGQKGAAGPRLGIPLKKLDPELFGKIVKLIGNRKSGNLLKGLDGKNLLGDSVNIINKSIMPKGVNLRGKKGKLTVGDYRKMALTDAFKIGGDQLREFVKLELVKQKKNITQRYTIQDYNANWKKFIDGRKALDKRKVTSVKEKVVADVTGTKAQQIKYWENTVASIKRDIKNAKSAGERENLQSQLRGASMQLFGVKNIKEKRAARLPEEVIFKTKGETKEREKFIKRVMKKNNLTEEQLKQSKLKPGVLAEFSEGIIKLEKGKFQPAEFYHENLHRLKEFARLSKNKGLTKLIERGEKLAVNTKEYKAWKLKNKNRDVEEFLADVAGGKASRIQFPKKTESKLGQFIKQLVSRVKVALGVGNFKDISNVIAKKLEKGFSTEGVQFERGRTRFKMEGMTDSEAVKYGRKVFDEYFDKKTLQRGMRAKLEKYIGELGQIDKFKNPGENFILKNANPVEVEMFVSTLRNLNKNFVKKLPDILGWFEAFKNVEYLRLSRNITESRRNSLLKGLGVTDGNVNLASAKQLRDFAEVLQTVDRVKNSTTAWIDQRVAAGIVDKKLADKFTKLKGAQAVVPVTTVLEYVGLNKLAQKVYGHTASKLGYEGRISVYEDNMQRIYGKKRFEEIKDYTYLFDKDRYFDRLENNYLTNREKKFINETFDINIEKKTMTPKKGQSGEIVRAHSKLMKSYKDEFFQILKEILNEAEYEKFLKDKPVEWIRNNIYVQRRLTPQAKLALEVDSNQYNKTIKRETETVAKKLARNYFERELKRNYTKEQFEKKIQSLIDDGTALSVAKANIAEARGGFNAVKHSPNFYKNRHEKLPEKIMYEGKMIETYERAYSTTTKDYAIGQAQFLSTLEFFPEYIRMKGFNAPQASDLIPRMKAGLKTRKVANYIDTAIKDIVGIGGTSSILPKGFVSSFLRPATSLAAQLQLSSPTSGLKNALVGQTQNFLAFRNKDYLKSLADIIHRDNRLMVKATGATEIGMRSIEIQGLGGRIDNFGKKAFKLGGMKPSEDFNRYTSVLAGKRDQLYLSRILQTAKEGTKIYKKATTKLKDFYKLADDEIALLKEFGMDGIQGLSVTAAKANKRKLDKLYQKMNTFSHVNTQGAAINSFMPLWARDEVAQSALLYKRMAYAATVNTVRNLNIARKNKSLFQFAAFMGGTYFSGEIMIGIYDKLFGQTMPKENSEKYKLLATTLWKGEFMGILSELFSPYENKGFFGSDTLYPSLLSTGKTLYDTVMAVAQGDRFVSQGLNDIGRNLFGIYNATYKTFAQGAAAGDTYAKESKRYAKLYSDYLEEIKDKDEVLNLNKSNVEYEANKYMRAFRELFESGRTKDMNGNSIGKWYMMCLFAKANDLYYAKYDENGIPVITHKEAMARAAASMKKSLRDLNPNKAAITAKDKKTQKQQLIKSVNFLNWLDRNATDDKDKLSKGLEKLNSQYAFRYEQVKKSADEYVKSANLKKDLEYYGIPLAKILK